jgi:hypothetical protein
MGTGRQRDRLILAIHTTPRGFGFVVLEGPGRTIDWGTKEARGDKNRIVLKKAGELMSWYQPDLLILENTEASESRRADRIRDLHRQLADLAITHKAAVRQFTRAEIRAAFASRAASTRYEIAQAVSRELPDLAPWLPPPRKIWESENRKLSIFDAASLALTFYDKQKTKPVSQTATA